MYVFLQFNTEVWRFPHCTTLNDPELKRTWQMVVWLLEGRVLTFSTELSSVSEQKTEQNPPPVDDLSTLNRAVKLLAAFFGILTVNSSFLTTKVMLADPAPPPPANDLSVLLHIHTTKYYCSHQIDKIHQTCMKWTQKVPTGQLACFCWMMDAH